MSLTEMGITQETQDILNKCATERNQFSAPRYDFTKAPSMRGLSFENYGYKDFRQSKGRNVDFIESNFSGADFEGSDMARADFTGATLKRTCFSQSNMQGVKFINANLEQASFVKTDLANADFTGANLEGACFLNVRNMPYKYEHLCISS